jgi:serine phosphatase RsbU (regulator of sigma subunit)
VLCLQEACANAILHSGTPEIEILILVEGDDLVVEVGDNGRGVDVGALDPCVMPHPLSPGGRGLPLIAGLMDETTLTSNGGLRLRMVKRTAVRNGASERGYTLSDLLDLEELQHLLDKCHEAFICPSAVVDNEARVLTASGWRDICTQFHRCHPESLKDCQHSDLYIFDHLHEGADCITYPCPRGLIDCASPIVIDGQHLGNVFIGQVLLEQPDHAFFKDQARRFGFDEEAYLAAVSQVPVLTRDELDRRLPFLRALAEMVAEMGLARLRDRGLNRELAAKARENELLYEQQWRIAETLQENLIHPLPDVSGLELAVSSRTAFEPERVGGDFHDVFLLDDHTVAILVGDVAGKGLRAAGLTETIRSTVHAFATIDRSPAFILRKTNQLLLQRHADEELVTAFLLVLDTVSGQAEYATAAHPAPVLATSGSCGPLALSYGLPLGSFDEDYRNSHTRLEVGDLLVFYTDGVTEARCGRWFFGEERLRANVADARCRPIHDAAHSLRDDVLAYATCLSDDLHIVALRRTA